jgi:hypothetical protein
MAAPPWYRTRTVLSNDSRFSDPTESAKVDRLDWNTRSTMTYWNGANFHVRRSSRNRARERKLESEREEGCMGEGGSYFSSLGCVLSSSYVSASSLYRGGWPIKGLGSWPTVAPTHKTLTLAAPIHIRWGAVRPVNQLPKCNSKC